MFKMRRFKFITRLRKVSSEHLLCIDTFSERVDRGGGGTGIRGAGDGGKGGGGRGLRGRGTGEERAGEEGAGVGKFVGRELYQNLLYFTDFTLFLCT